MSSSSGGLGIEIEVVEASSTSGKSKQDESYLSDVNTRNLFVDDLLEVNALHK